MSKRPPPNAGAVIAAWRRRLGLSQEKLARRVGITVSTVNRWENGKTFPGVLAWARLEQVAKEMRVPIQTDGKEEEGQ